MPVVHTWEALFLPRPYLAPTRTREDTAKGCRFTSLVLKGLSTVGFLLPRLNHVKAFTRPRFKLILHMAKHFNIYGHMSCQQNPNNVGSPITRFFVIKPYTILDCARAAGAVWENAAGLT